MGKFYMNVTLDLIMEELLLNKDFKIKKAELINNMHSDFYSLELLIEHEQVKNKYPIPHGIIEYKKDKNGNPKIYRITLDGSNVKFDNIDYYKEEK